MGTNAGSVASRILHDRSSLVLMAANLIPLIWAAKEGWQGGDLITLYWMETALLWAVVLLKMGLYVFLWEPGPDDWYVRPAMAGGLLLLFGIVLIPSLFFWTLAGLHLGRIRGLPGSSLEALDLLQAMLDQAGADARGRFRGPLVGLGAAHLFSVTYDFVLRKEWKLYRIEQFAMEPAIRLAALWTLVVAGPIVAGTVAWPLRNVLGLDRAASLGWFAALFLVKVGMDVALRFKERESGGFGFGRRPGGS